MKACNVERLWNELSQYDLGELTYGDLYDTIEGIEGVQEDRHVETAKPETRAI